MPGLSLRPYQLNAIEEIRAHIRRGRKRIVLVAPTGSGKTVIAAEMIRAADAMGSSKLFLAHRKELIAQCSAKLSEYGVPHGIIRANDPRRRPWLTTHVCSVATLARRWQGTMGAFGPEYTPRGSPVLPRADILFIDECHHAGATTYRNIIARYPNAVVIGLTATPIRDNGRGLGDLFEEMVQCPPMAELTEMGFLVPSVVYAPSRPDLTAVKTTGGDYQNDDLARVMDRATLTGDAVAHWKKHAADRLGVCFAVNVKHSKHIVEQFVAAGIAAEHLDGTMADTDRDALIARWRSGQTQVVSNCMVLTEGFDFPEASAVLLCRPTQSLGLWLQMVGRVLRPAAGKGTALILDHAGSTYEFGLPDDSRDWKLEYPKRKRRTKSDEPPLNVRMCVQCWAAFSSRLMACPHCGWQYVSKAVQPEVIEGELEQITRLTLSDGKMKLSHDPEIAELQKIAAEKGYRRGWVWVEYERIKRRRAREEAARASGAPQRAVEIMRGATT